MARFVAGGCAKKLIAAVDDWRTWQSKSAAAEEEGKALADAGIKPKPKAIAPLTLALWPENITAFKLYLRSGSIWRRCPWSGRLLGLDYPALETLIRLTRTPRKEANFTKMQWIEQHYLDLSEKK